MKPLHTDGPSFAPHGLAIALSGALGLLLYAVFATAQSASGSASPPRPTFPGMTRGRQAQLPGNYERLRRLPREESAKLRELNRAVAASPDRAQLQDVMRRYHAWARELGPAARVHLRRTPSAQRQSKVVMLRDWLALAPPIENAPGVDEDGLVHWVADLLLDEKQRQDLLGAPFPQRCAAAVEAARGVGWLQSQPGTAYAGPPVPTAQINDLVSRLSTAEQAALRTLGEEAQRVRIGWRVRLLALKHVPPSSGRSNDDDCARFFREEVAASPDALDHFLKLPAHLFEEQLSLLYSDAHPQ